MVDLAHGAKLPERLDSPKKRISLGLPAVRDEVADHLVSVLLGISQ